MLKRARKPAAKAEYEAALTLPLFPMDLKYLWDAFWRLRRRKGGNGFGPSPIEWPDIDAFTRHSRMSLAAWEVEIIEMLDDLYLSAKIHSG